MASLNSPAAVGLQGHINPPKVSVLIMAPEMPHQIRTSPPDTPKESSDPVATSTMEMGSSQSPGGVAHPASPDQGAPVLGQERQVTLSEAVSYLHQVKAQFIDQPDIYNTFAHILIDLKSRV
ncbi:hypothetical protein V490_00204 [Pseudogymnoascus sp. VKM F-3557]|nr:hypothetical protein V490_00204 [Pseudogymnoascus sp. VKM F-3557]